MRDACGREINYLRLSLTDRCNLRCRYCMPTGVPSLPHSDILSYEELLLVCEAAVGLGIDRFKVTGGEPLVRKGCVDFLRRLRALPGVHQVSLTTNGVLLPDVLEVLADLPLDGINLSLDTLDPQVYQHLTGGGPGDLDKVLLALERSVALGLPTKVNAVLVEQAFSTLPQVLLLAKRLPVDVRLIELMPIGEGLNCVSVSRERALALIKALFPGLHPLEGKRGNGPARYFHGEGLLGTIGLIEAVSQQFCHECNRVRLTSVGLLKPCLCYSQGLALRPVLQSGASLAALREAMAECIYHKPASHCFGQADYAAGQETMNQIGG